MSDKMRSLVFYFIPSILSFFLPSAILGYPDPAVSTPTDNSVEGIDLVSFLTTKSQQHDAIFTEAVQLLESFKTSPSCNRIAASKLVTSCQSIGERSDHGNIDTETYISLERARSVYAARLAICEINGAGTSIPSDCVAVTVSAPAKRRLFSFSRHSPQANQADGDSITTHLLEACLKSLESRPQWWTSYSNSRQNAVVICQASRIEKEKEELLELQRSIVESSVKLNRGLSEALQMASVQSDQHKAFLNEIETMQVRLREETESMESKLKLSFTNILQSLETGITSAAAATISAIERAQHGASSLGKNINNTSAEAHKLRHVLEAAHHETILRNEQMALSAERTAQAHNDFALSLQSRLQDVLQDGLARVSQNITTFDSLLEWLATRLGLILQQEQSISERLRAFENSLEETRVKAKYLEDSQLRQYQTVQANSELQDNLQFKMQTSQAFIEKTTAAVANLHATIDDTTVRYKESGIFSSWTVSCLLLILLYIQSPRLAVAVLGLGAIVWVSDFLIRMAYIAAMLERVTSSAFRLVSWG